VSRIHVSVSGQSASFFKAFAESIEIRASACGLRSRRSALLGRRARHEEERGRIAHPLDPEGLTWQGEGSQLVARA
jgi:hypothetical protein